MTKPSSSDGHLYLLPLEPTGVTLQSHVATLLINYDGGTAPIVTLDATYALQNPGTAPVTILLRLAPRTDLPTASGTSAPQNASLFADGQPLALQPSENGGFTTQVTIGADSRTLLSLNYQLPLSEPRLLTLRYAPATLNQWPGSVSLRVELSTPDTIPAESWTHLLPDTWSYALAAQPDRTTLKWLYDVSIPDQSFILQFVHPALWGQIQTASAQASGNGQLADSIRLGDLYRTLYDAAIEHPLAGETVANRFYSQAVAAYSAGIALVPLLNPPPQEVAALHTGLATLYRSRLLNSTGIAATQYARLLVEEAATARAALETDLTSDPNRRRELTQWQADGLRLLLNDAQDRRAWQEALDMIDQFRKLSDSVVDLTALAEQREIILVRQALLLMEQGEREAALAIAGPRIEDAELSPPNHAHPLFTSWQISVTVGTDEQTLVALGIPTPSNEQRALENTEQIVAEWQNGLSGVDPADRDNYQFSITQIPPASDSDSPAIILEIQFPPLAHGQWLATLLPAEAHWAFLRSALNQLAPTIERQSRMSWQQVRFTQPMDLRGASDQWAAMAAGLERQAAEFDAQAADQNLADPQSALQNRIKAVSYRAVAEEWRNLTQTSWLLYLFKVYDPWRDALDAEMPQRSWYATPVTPTQMFSFQVQLLDISRFIVIVIFALAIIILLTSVLWWLL